MTNRVKTDENDLPTTNLVHGTPSGRLLLACASALLASAGLAAPAHAAPKDGAVRREAAAALEKFHKRMRDGFPLKAGELDGVEAATKKLPDGPSRWYFENELRRYQARLAIKQGDAATAAQQLEAALALEGTVTGPAGNVVVKAEADHCYALLFRTKKAYAPGEFRIQIEGNAPSVQSFAVWQPLGWKEPSIHGFCALKGEKVTVSVGMPKETPAGSADYAVLSWTRDKLPISVIGRAYLEPGDICDHQRWETLWTQPVPGTLVYSGSTPTLITNPGEPRNGEKPKGRGTHYGELRLSPASLSPTPQGAVTVSSLGEFPGCPYKFTMTSTNAAHTKKIKACHDQIDKKYEPAWKSIMRLRDAASKQHAISPKAEKMAADLEAKQRKERHQRCTPLEQKAENDFRATLEALARTLSASPPKDTLDRAGYLREMYE